jgi:hypothetical protein
VKHPRCKAIEKIKHSRYYDERGCHIVLSVEAGINCYTSCKQITAGDGVRNLFFDVL